MLYNEDKIIRMFSGNMNTTMKINNLRLTYSGTLLQPMNRVYKF